MTLQQMHIKIILRVYNSDKFDEIASLLLWAKWMNRQRTN